MRPSLRFLGIAVVGWMGIRAAALGMLPGAGLFRIEASEAKTPPITPTQFPPIEPVAVAQAGPAPGQYPPTYAQYAQYAAYPQQPMRAMVVPLYYPAPVSTPAPSRSPHLDALTPWPRSTPYGSVPAADDMPMSRLAAVSIPARSSIQVQITPEAQPVRPKLDRLQLSSWALLRSQQTGIAGSRSLASGGQLGASQAGARLIYNFNRQFALAARMSSEVGRRGGEVATGIRVRPLVNVPVWVTAERRQRIGRFGGGRNDFALFAEAGLYQRPLAWGLSLDS